MMMMMMVAMAMTMMIAIVLPMLALLSMRPKPLIYDAAAPSWVCTALDKYYCKWARDECTDSTDSAPRKSTDNKCQRHCHMVWQRLPGAFAYGKSPMSNTLTHTHTQLTYTKLHAGLVSVANNRMYS